MKYEWGYINRYILERRNGVVMWLEVEWTRWRELEKIVFRMRKNILDILRNSCERFNIRKK